MGLTYFKRFRMEIDLKGRSIAAPQLPAGYRFVPWDESLVEAHAETKFRSFRDEIDANVFPCLGERIGCSRLMGEIRQKPGFLAGATWLVTFDPILADVDASNVDTSDDPASADFGNLDGFCVRSGYKSGFPKDKPRLPAALVEVEYCGTIQGIVDRNGMGAVQNLGVAPEHRSRGLGRALMLKAMQGFSEAALKHVFLEVTSQNEGAIRLYRHLGFNKARTIYKVVEVAYS